MRRRFGVVLAFVMAAAVGGFAYVRYVDHEDVGTKDLVVYGNIDIRQVDLAFNVQGRIDAMLIEEGERVRPELVMARLDATRYQARLDAARAAVAAQRAAVSRLEAGSRPEEIEKARADVQAAEAHWKMARATLERQGKLAGEQFASQQALDEAQAAERQALEKLNALKQDLALAIAGPRTEDIVEANAKLKGADAQLALAQSEFDDTVLYAPADGIVLSRVQEGGAVIQASSPVYVMALSDPLWVRTYVSEPDLGRVFPGMKAIITTDSSPDQRHEGWVGFISPEAEFTPKTVQTTEIRTSLVYRVRVYVKNRDGSLRQGMPVTVRLIEEQSQGGAPAVEPEN